MNGGTLIETQSVEFKLLHHAFPIVQTSWIATTALGQAEEGGVIINIGLTRVGCLTKMFPGVSLRRA